MYIIYATLCYVVVCTWCICCSHWKLSQIPIQAICDLAVELAYSRSGLSQMEGMDALENENTMKKTLSLGRFRHQYVGLFHAGSSAEGLAVQDTWGHEPADQDEMLLFGQRLCVHIPHGFQSPDESLLIYRPEGCPPGYCKLEVIDTQALKQTSVWDQQLSASCIQSSGNQHWLHTANTLIRIQQAKSAVTPDSVYKSTYISGPTEQAASGLVEYVPTLVGNGPYPNLEEYRNIGHLQNWLMKYRSCQCYLYLLGTKTVVIPTYKPDNLGVIVNSNWYQACLNTLFKAIQLLNTPWKPSWHFTGIKLRLKMVEVA